MDAGVTWMMNTYRNRKPIHRVVKTLYCTPGLHSYFRA